MAATAPISTCKPLNRSVDLKLKERKRYKALSFSICGGRQARIRVERRNGFGTYTLQANIP